MSETISQTKENSNLKATVFDIQRFSMHDGDGIRTNVFFSGCPLSCVWCHNPEGLSSKYRPIYFENRCISCGICVNLSKQNGVKYKEDKKIILDITKDEDWNNIIYECPTQALKWNFSDFTIDELMKEVLKDEIFYKRNGGVTVSGGEPLLQHKFVVEFLKELQKQNIHTTIETSLSVDLEIVKSVLPYLDSIYCDLKIFDSNLHKKFTGQENKQILENITYILNSEYKGKVRVRTPMIPTITDNKENIANIAKFISNSYKDVEYEILNYNQLAGGKYPLVDKEYYFKENISNFTKKEMKEFLETAINNGILNGKTS